MTTVLVTGGTGLVGTALKEVCKDTQEYTYKFLSSKDCDLTNYEQTHELFSQRKPTIVIHLAGYVGGLFRNMNEKVNMFEKNLLMNFNVVKVSYEVGVTKFIGCLSTCIFPDKITYPINETDVHKGEPHTSNFGYAYAKRALDTHCRSYREQYGVNYFCITPTNIYGKNDNFSLTDGHVIPSLIHKCYLAKQNNEPFVVSGTGKPLRQFIYSTDLANLIMVLIRHNTKELTNIILSVSENDEVSIAQVANIIAEQFKYQNRLTYDTTKSDGQFKKTADNDMLMKFLKHNKISFQFTPIEKGIRETVAWFVKNYATTRQ